MNLDECLEKYKNITLELIDKTKHGEDLEKLINERADVINRIGNIEFSKEEFENRVETLKIQELDKELQKLVNEEKVKIKNQIDNFKKARILRKSYNNSHQTSSFFSAKT